MLGSCHFTRLLRGDRPKVWHSKGVKRVNRSTSVCGAAIDRRGTLQAELSSLVFSYSSSWFIEISAAPSVTPNE
jgi:hypothetical protein